MKKAYLKGIALAGLISLGFLACKEDDKLEASLTVQLLAGKYRLTAITQSTAVTPETSLMGRIPDCAQDDLYQLKSDTTGNYIDAGVSCGGNDSYPFDYQITAAEVHLFVEALAETGFTGGKVIKWDGTNLQLQAKVKNEITMNIATTITATFVKQPG